ncbi:MAG: beta-ketoacyl synthase N-terminal-like domain-containing protein [Desulfopila sp.]
MSDGRVYIAAAGVVSPLGSGLTATFAALLDNRSAIVPLSIFPLTEGPPLPVGQVSELADHDPRPRSHRLAKEAARMAMAGCSTPPDAVILGSTTGGILTTEQLLRDGVNDPARYRYHGLKSLADDIVELVACPGPGIMVSTACSSGAVAIALALRLLRCGEMERILVGGVDSLCRLTYFGFHALQLVDRQGARPLDTTRQGISVAEAGAMLLLTSRRPAAPLGLVLGAGLSCDAYHPTAPHPEGLGARAAMAAAMADAGLTPADIDYINLHGTGTQDNDLAETRAIRHIFPTVPALSSLKGATGHSLAAAGALEAVCATLAVSRGLVPGNCGCRQPDPALAVTPQLTPAMRPVGTVLSTSLGFGGNNGALIIGREDSTAIPRKPWKKVPLAVHGKACLTGAGDLAATLVRLTAGDPAAGPASTDQIPTNIPPRLLRRAKRLSRLALFLAAAAHQDSGGLPAPSSVFMGTAWGALSATWSFLEGLAKSNERFASPTDFVGSVHNGAAGQIALLFQARGANVTTSGGDSSFEQALMAAEALLEPGQAALVAAADEHHGQLSPLLEPAHAPESVIADGGGALYLTHDPEGACCLLRMALFRRAMADDPLDDLVRILTIPDPDNGPVLAVFAGIAGPQVETGERQLATLLARTTADIPIFRFRSRLGAFSSVSAVAAVLAAHCLQTGVIPANLTNGCDLNAENGRILLIGFGDSISVVDFFRSVRQ